MSPTPPHKWTGRQISELLRLRDEEGRFFTEISEALCIAAKVCSRKYQNLKAPPKPPKKTQAPSFTDVRPDPAPPPEAIADAQARARLQYDSLTAAFFRDPLPGRSALDQRQREPASQYMPVRSWSDGCTWSDR